MRAPKARRQRLLALLGLVLLAVVAATALWFKGPSAELADRPAGERPELLLLTALPIVFPEHLALNDIGSPALGALQRRYRVVPISLADRKSLAGHKLLLMAQPQAQPAEVLVELDEWVRAGGRVLLLADPALEWPSDLALGDPLRPPPAFADTGLLGHWGLRLDAPDSLSARDLSPAGRTIRTAAPGRLAATSPGCSVEPSRLVGRCAIGKGEAIVIADADFLDANHVPGAKGAANLGLLLFELAQLE